MGWQPPGKPRERVLVYGPMGSWKTCGALEIAGKIDSQVWVVDTDNAYGMILDRMYSYLDNVHVFDGSQGWEDAVKGIEWAFGNAGRDDWVVLDSMSDLWDFCMDHFTELATGKDLPKYLLDWAASKSSAAEAARVGGQSAMVADGLYPNWINPTWRREIVRRTKAAKCHLYMTAQSTVAGQNPKEDQLTKNLYMSYGWKPRTQKEIGFNAATVLLLDRDKMGKATYSTVKDWGRSGKELARDVRYESLARDWLMKVAGWRPGKTEGKEG